jgi:hypothetical protein
MKQGLFAKSALALFVLASLVAIDIVDATPAAARVVVGFGPFWGFPFPYPYPYPYPYAYPYPAPPPYYAPSAAYAAPADPGYGVAPSTWYYCANPRGYYPDVPQCNSGWRAVPASSVH